MASTCTVHDSFDIAKGDAVCVVGWDTSASPHRPKVARASAARLATSKTVFGVAAADAVDGDPIAILVAGEVASATDHGTDLGPVFPATTVPSRIVATNITATDPDPATEASLQCRLIRVDRPDGSEHVVGTCDENGHLSLQPRASRTTSAQHVYNVKSYGAVGDDATYCDAAFAAAMQAVADATSGFQGGTIRVPKGTYRLQNNLYIARNIIFEGETSDTRVQSAASVLKFDAGACLILLSSVTAEDEGTGAGAYGTVIRNLQVLTDTVEDITIWAPATTYEVGDVVRLPNNREYLYECIVAPDGGGLSAAYPSVAEQWTANTAYALGDVVYPTEANLNGHMYHCAQVRNAGETGAAEPSWDFAHNSITPRDGSWDGDVRWEEDGIIAALVDFPYVPVTWGALAATDPSVRWTASHAYPNGAVVIGVRTDGSLVTDFVFDTGSPGAVAGTSGLTAPAWDEMGGADTTDGTITWIARDSAPYLVLDNEIWWACRVAPGIGVQTVASLENVYVSGATSAGVHIQAGAESFSNASFWRMNNVNVTTDLRGDGGGGPGFVVRGGDTNGGVANGLVAIGNAALPPSEWNAGFVDDSQFGCTWVGCYAEYTVGYPFVAYQNQAGSTFVGCLSETPSPARIGEGSVVLGGAAFRTPSSVVRDSPAPAIAPNGSWNLDTVDTRNQAEDGITLRTFFAGSQRSNNLGRMGLGFQAVGAEPNAQGFCFGDYVAAVGAYPAWPEPGWWVWCYGPETYGAAYAPLAISGSTSTALRGQESPTGELMLPRGGYYIGDASSPNRFELGTAPPTLGTWLPGDRIWNPAPDFNGPAGWICIETGAPGAWVPLPISGSPQLTIATADADVDLTAEPAMAAHGIFKLTGTLTTERSLVLPLPADEDHAYTRIIRNKCTDAGGSLAIRSSVGGSVIVGFNATATVGVDPDGVFRVTSDSSQAASNLVLTGWWQAPYGGSPWSGTGSAGPSAGRSLSEATNPPTVGAAEKGKTAADFDGVDDQLGKTDDFTTFVTASAGSAWVLFKADVAAADAGAGSRRVNPGLLCQSGGLTCFVLTFSDAGVAASLYDGAWQEATVACPVLEYHLAQVKWDSATLRVRIDNGVWETIAAGALDGANAGALLVGVNYNAQYFDGSILEVGTASTALADADFDGILAAVRIRYDQPLPL